MKDLGWGQEVGWHGEPVPPFVVRQAELLVRKGIRYTPSLGTCFRLVDGTIMDLREPRPKDEDPKEAVETPAEPADAPAPRRRKRGGDE